MKLTTGLPQSHSSPCSTKPFPHTGGSTNCERQVKRVIIHPSEQRKYALYLHGFVEQAGSSTAVQEVIVLLHVTVREPLGQVVTVFSEHISNQKNKTLFKSHICWVTIACVPLPICFSSFKTNMILSGLIWGLPYLQMTGDPYHNTEADRVLKIWQELWEQRCV